MKEHFLTRSFNVEGSVKQRLARLLQRDFAARVLH